MELKLAGSDPFENRHFIFADKEVGRKSAGLYRYRVEVSFKDASYQFLKERLIELARMSVLLNDYYDLSVSGENIYPNKDFYFDANMRAEEYKKASFKSYFQNGSFDSTVFPNRAANHFNTYDETGDSVGPEILPWYDALPLISEIFEIFGIYDNFDHAPLMRLISPTTGSPKGISFVIKLLDTCIKKTSNIIGYNKSE